MSAFGSEKGKNVWGCTESEGVYFNDNVFVHFSWDQLFGQWIQLCSKPRFAFSLFHVCLTSRKQWKCKCVWTWLFISRQQSNSLKRDLSKSITVERFDSSSCLIYVIVILLINGVFKVCVIARTKRVFPPKLSWNGSLWQNLLLTNLVLRFDGIEFRRFKWISSNRFKSGGNIP